MSPFVCSWDFISSFEALFFRPQQLKKKKQTLFPFIYTSMICAPASPAWIYHSCYSLTDVFCSPIFQKMTLT